MGPQGTAGCPQAAPLHWGQGLPFPVPATPAMTQQIPECSGGSELGREAFTQMPELSCSLMRQSWKPPAAGEGEATKGRWCRSLQPRERPGEAPEPAPPTPPFLSPYQLLLSLVFLWQDLSQIFIYV